MAYAGHRFSAAEAKDWGVVKAVHPDHATTLAAAFALAQDIAAKSPLAIAGIKQAITFARDHPLADGLKQIAGWNDGMLRAKDLMKAIQAKMAKEMARFDNLLGDTE